MRMADRPVKIVREAAASKKVAGTRVYEVWKGRNRFFLGGRLIFGPDVRSLMLTIVLIVLPAVVFCLYITREILHEFSHRLGIATFVAVVVQTIVVLFLLLLTSSRDPGIIPRNKHPPEPEDDFEISNLNSDLLGGLTPRLRVPQTKDVIVNGVAIKIKYCHTCMLYRPPRCSHCSICNNCVERFDHHCPWVGQCIGQRNYLFFMMFVSMTTILCIYVFVMSAILVKKLMGKQEYHTLWRAFSHTPASVILMLYTFIGTWFVGGLTIFHLYLISKNQTTYENFRYRYDKKVNPYDMGIDHNCKEIFCTRVPASKNEFRARVEEEPPFGSTFGKQDAAKTEGQLISNTRIQSVDIESDARLGWRPRVERDAAEDMKEQGRLSGNTTTQMTLAKALGHPTPTTTRDDMSESSWNQISKVYK